MGLDPEPPLLLASGAFRGSAWSEGAQCQVPWAESLATPSLQGGYCKLGCWEQLECPADTLTRPCRLRSKSVSAAGVDTETHLWALLWAKGEGPVGFPGITPYQALWMLSSSLVPDDIIRISER